MDHGDTGASVASVEVPMEASGLEGDPVEGTKG